MSFFPCTRFETKACLLMRCDGFEQQKWEPQRKLEYSMRIGKEQQENYQLWCEMFSVVRRKNQRMIVENPMSSPSYLTTYFCEKPALKDKNRRERGDYMAKPTQYWFVNCKPENNVIMESLDYVSVRVCDYITKDRTRVRSEIHPQYARRFIREFILDAN